MYRVGWNKIERHYEVDHGRVDVDAHTYAEQQQAANTHKRCTSEA